MARRFLLLAGLCVLLGVATNAFGQDVRQAPWITREGAVAMLVESKPEWRAELEHMRANPQPLPIYHDTDPGEWYVPYLEVAFAHGLIEATDFHREFRPGELLKQGEAIALAVRYRANGDASQIPQEEPDHPLSIPLHVQKGYEMNLEFPEPFESWNVIRRGDWLALIESAGVANPAAIVVTIPPRTTPPAVAPVPQLPVTGPFDPQSSPTPPYAPPAQTGYKPSDSAPQPPHIAQRPTGIPPSAPTHNPSYVPNPPGARPVSSDDPPYVPPSAASQPRSSAGSTTVASPAATSAFTISIPALGISNLTVTHPTNVTSQAGLLAPLQHGVGHLFSYPGNGGTTLIYGHSSSYAWDVSEYTKIFRQINKLNPGDRVVITYGGRIFTYEVTHKQTVDASDMSAYQQNNGERLILYTCWPPDDIKQRYLVHAKPV